MNFKTLYTALTMKYGTTVGKTEFDAYCRGVDPAILAEFDPCLSEDGNTYDLSGAFEAKKTISRQISSSPTKSASVKKGDFQTDVEFLVPDGCPHYTPTVDYHKIVKILKSEKWYPTYVVGPAGSGKTLAIMQACHELGLPCIRHSCSSATDEYTLFGSQRLVNGENRYYDGPVTVAARHGGVVILDEVDFCSPNGTAQLHAFLEGSKFSIPSTGETIKRHELCKVMMTANTKGRGDISGFFNGSQVLNGAFRDRPRGYLNFPHNTQNEDIAIMRKVAENDGVMDSAMERHIKDLAFWAYTTREAAKQTTQTPAISTRVLVGIIEGFSIFGDIPTAMRMAIGQYDDEMVETLVKMFDRCIQQNAKPAAAV